MILSHRYGFIFLKTRKTAGTSIELMLRGILGPSDVATPLSKEEEREAENAGLPGPRNYLRPLLQPRVNRTPARISKFLTRFFTGRRPPEDRIFCPYIQHMNARLARDNIGVDLWRRYLVFCVERNPWASSLSHYRYRYRGNRRPPAFRDFIERGENCAHETNYEVYSIRGVPAADLVIDYENLNEGLSGIASHLDRPIDLGAEAHGIKAKSYGKPSGEYRDWYNASTRRIVSLQFAREIAFMRYAFD